MIPLKLELANFLSYRQPTTLDFRGLKVACIAGENGAGKSSLLDAITWALFGKARARSDDDLISSGADEAEVRFTFALEGNIYRVIRQRRRGKGGLLELQVQAGDDRWKTLTGTRKRETQEQIEGLLRMRYETFINASFLLQGRADEFTVKRPGERKEVLGEILGLSRWNLYQEEARNRRRTQERSLALLEARLQEVEAELAEEPQRRQALQQARARVEALSQQIAAQERLLEQVRAYEAAIAQQQALLKNVADHLVQARQQLARLEETRVARQAELEGYRTALAQAAEIEARYARWQEVEARLREWQTKAEEVRRLQAARQEPALAVEGERARLEQERLQLQRQARRVESMRKERETVTALLAQVREELAQVTEQLVRRDALQEQRDQRRQEIAVLEAEQDRLSEEGKRLRSRLETLRAEGEAGLCPLCGQPLTEDHRAEVIAQIEAEGEAVNQRYRENQQRLHHLKAEVKTLEQQLARLRPLERRQPQLQRKEAVQSQRLEEIAQALQEWEQEGAPHLAELEARLAEGRYAVEAQARLAELEAAIAAVGYDPEAHAETRREWESLTDAPEAYQRLQNARAAIAPLETTLADLARQITDQEAQVARLEAQRAEAQAQLDQLTQGMVVDRTTVEAELERLRAEEAVARRRLGAAEQRVAVIEDLQEQKRRLEAKRQAVALAIGRLKRLERAFGRDGIQAMLIEQALPEIEATANELLTRLTGGEMTVRFETQRPLKTRDGLKETLEIIISDSAGPRAYELFSGGEAFRVNFAIRLALSQVLARRAGARLQTLVIDEGFGSQDPEGRQRLVEAINAIQDDFARILVITHIEELRDAFPVRIQVTKTPQGSQIEIL